MHVLLLLTLLQLSQLNSWHPKLMIFAEVTPHASSSFSVLAKVSCSRLIGGIEAFLRDFSTADKTRMHSPTHSEYLSVSAVEAGDEAEEEEEDEGDGASCETRPVVQRCNTRAIACKSFRRLPFPK